ncbi:hypothetical protein GC173_14220 [bacterium]|nr:hypothetical protein [bacterium]
MNHLEQLVSEWLQFNGYFVRTSVLVGRRAKGGYDGELDVVALNHATGHALHVECSLDALSYERREPRFAAKFERGRRHIGDVFPASLLTSPLDQVALLHFGSSARGKIGGARIVSGKDFVQEILNGLRGTSSAKSAVPTVYPLIRTLQLAQEVSPKAQPRARLIPAQDEQPVEA